jgi:hypothetical protein
MKETLPTFGRISNNSSISLNSTFFFFLKNILCSQMTVFS